MWTHILPCLPRWHYWWQKIKTDLCRMTSSGLIFIPNFKKKKKSRPIIIYHTEWHVDRWKNIQGSGIGFRRSFIPFFDVQKNREHVTYCNVPYKDWIAKIQNFLTLFMWIDESEMLYTEIVSVFLSFASLYVFSGYLRGSVLMKIVI